MTPFERLLADPYAARRYLVVLEPWDRAAGAVVTLHYSDHGFTTEPGDTPANTHFAARLHRDFVFRLQRDLFGDGRIAGRSQASRGEVVLANPDGALDGLLGHAWDGRRVRVLLGAPDFALADFGVVFTGTAEGIRADDDLIAIIIRDPAARFDRPLQPLRYLGTGGSEGGEDLADKPKPDAFGLVRNVEGVYLGLVEGRETWQVSAGPIADVPACYSNGLALVRAEGKPAAGEYAVDAAAGLLTLGGGSLGTIVTADVKGAVGAAGWLSSAPAIARHIAVARGGLADPEEIDTAAFAALEALCPQVVGLWSEAETTVAEALDSLFGSIGAWWGFDRLGRLSCGRIEPPSATPAAGFDDGAALAIERLEVALPAWRVTLGYGRCWRVLSGAGLAGGVDETRRRFLAAGERRAAAEDASLRIVHPLAGDETVASLLDDAADAAAEAARRLALFGAPREAFRARLKTQPFLLDLGATVELRSARFGLADGRRLVVIGMTEDAAANEVTLILWG